MNKKNQFKAFFIFHYHNLFTRRSLALMVLFVIVAMFFVQNGVNDYNRSRASPAGTTTASPQFPPASILLYRNIEGSKVFMRRGLRMPDFTGFLYMVGALMLMFYGFDTFRNIPFMRMLESHTGRVKLFWLMIASRYLLLNLLFLILIGMAVLMITAHGVALMATDLSAIARYIIMWQLFSMIYFISGAFMGLMPERITGKSGEVSLFTFWLALFSVVPMALDTVLIDPKPLNILVGGLVMTGVIVALGFLSYAFFFKLLYHTKIDRHYREEYMNIQIALRPDEFTVYKFKQASAADVFYSLLTQPLASLDRKGLGTMMTLNGDRIPRDRDNFTITGNLAVQYFAAPGRLPGDVTAQNLLTLFCRLSGKSLDTLDTLFETETMQRVADLQLSALTDEEQGRIILEIAQMKPGHYYLFDNTATGADFNFTKTFLDLAHNLNQQGATVLYLTQQEVTNSQLNKATFERLPYWADTIRAMAESK